MRGIFFCGPHYREIDGKMEGISLQLRAVEKFDGKTKSTFSCSSVNGPIDVLAKRGVIVARGRSNEISIEPIGSRNVDPVESLSGGLIYSDLWSGVDYEVLLTRVGVKSNLYVTSKSGQRKVRFRVSGEKEPTLNAPFYYENGNPIFVPHDVSGSIYEVDLSSVPVGSVVDPTTNIATNTVREARASGGTWSAARDSATATDYVANTHSVSWAYVDGGGTFYCTRSFLTFFTVPLGYGATVNSANLNFYVDYKGAGYVGLVSSTASDPMVASEFGNIGSTEILTRMQISALSSGWNYGKALNSTGIGLINPTGYTKFCTRGAYDIDNTSPSGITDHMNVAGELSSNDPYLEIDYTPGNGIFRGRTISGYRAGSRSSL